VRYACFIFCYSHFLIIVKKVEPGIRTHIFLLFLYPLKVTDETKCEIQVEASSSYYLQVDQKVSEIRFSGPLGCNPHFFPRYWAYEHSGWIIETSCFDFSQFKWMQNLRCHFSYLTATWSNRYPCWIRDADFWSFSLRCHKYRKQTIIRNWM